MTVFTATNLQPQSPFIAGQTVTVGAYFVQSGTGFANGDTLVASQLIPASGVEVLDVFVRSNQLDTNAAPTGTYSVGDSLADGNAVGRYITGAVMGTNVANAMIYNFSNVTPTVVSGAYTKGVGYFYGNDENTAGTGITNGNVDLVMTITNAVATASTTHNVWMYVTYRCVGNI
jgi:hypothetical protein